MCAILLRPLRRLILLSKCARLLRPATISNVSNTSKTIKTPDTISNVCKTSLDHQDHYVLDKYIKRSDIERNLLEIM